ncbi:MAG: helix-turn-helix domain-containing protein [Oscillospiraceae bacterium]|nr:helix-turn-helix domain-containing protein [Oscillospiraceae bacterium]MCQ2555600.1 helix-turn-helix domain-containing protein [Clostridia bacterium]
MDNGLFMKVDEVMSELGISKSHAYKLIKQLNNELSSKGFITVSGKISRQFFYEKVYGYKEVTVNVSV